MRMLAEVRDFVIKKKPPRRQIEAVYIAEVQ